MDYLTLAYLHLATILPAFLIATVQLVRPKGGPLHRQLGRLYMVLMLLTAVISLCMPASIGPVWLGHFGYIHLLSLLTLYAVPAAWQAARRGRIATHRRIMMMLYIGAFVLAGSFTLMPGRLIHGWLFGH
ncbi:hypothetical protein A11A3_11583 [Alcanivorax hongdengensis A-11-3]|uniref:Transmembrane protein n=1 Tax=Alcanivorax hongdengensis A-11-3 TaxID=1177179 RepID=L0WAQ8_9GAMM|nr:DUF2306 domain-containing protein [Alcanivorax hongdengensis]EKF73848.1 hypothetical protein A11A3_11583 [Alcanivorax hongdengensis A-11-3]